jgi:hypothetical protein
LGNVREIKPLLNEGDGDNAAAEAVKAPEAAETTETSFV